MRTARQKVTRRKVQRKGVVRARVTACLSFAAAILFVMYAIPCFAESIWDKGLPKQNAATSFSSPINDSAFIENAKELASQDVVSGFTAEDGIRASSKLDVSVAETTGPGIAANDDAVFAAKKRVEAVSAAKVEREAVIGAMSGVSALPNDRTLEIMTATCSLFMALLFSILGTRSIVSARTMRAQVVSATYSRALKA